MKKAFVLASILLLSVVAKSQAVADSLDDGYQFPKRVFSRLPNPQTSIGRVVQVIDCQSASNCSQGGGAQSVLFVSQADPSTGVAAWVPITTSGAAYALAVIQNPNTTIATPTGTPSTTGGTIAAGTNYAKIVAYDSLGGEIGLSSISAVVTTTGSSSSILWSWAPTVGASYYFVYFSTISSAGQFRHFVQVATTSFTQNAPTTSYASTFQPFGGNSTGIIAAPIVDTPTVNAQLQPPGQAIGQASASGGSMSTQTLYVTIEAVDAATNQLTSKSLESAPISVTGSTGSVALTWAAPTNGPASSYEIFVSNTSGNYSFFFTSTTNSFTETTDPSTGTAGTISNVNFSGQVYTGKLVAYTSFTAPPFLPNNTAAPFTISGCSASVHSANSASGQFNSGTTGTCTVTITLNGGTSPGQGWYCPPATDITTVADTMKQTAFTATTVTLTGTTVANDVIAFACDPI